MVEPEPIIPFQRVLTLDLALSELTLAALFETRLAVNKGGKTFPYSYTKW